MALRERRVLLLLSHLLLGTGFSFFYVQHVRTIFESRTNIAHLTQLERESMLRNEDALHYAFYKTLIQAPDFWSGYEKLKNVTDIEYPSKVNVLQRFYVLPEVAVAYFYHFMRRLSYPSDFPLISCWFSNDVSLSQEQRHQCDFSSFPMQFYLECVWFMGGFTMMVIYMYGTLLSENIFGGIYAVISYVMFHRFASKIYERPVARENFAFPLIFLQILYFCLRMQRVVSQKHYSLRFVLIFKQSVITALALLSWQFSTVIFSSQIVIMMTYWNAQNLPKKLSNVFFLDYSLSHLLGIGIAFWGSQYNKQLLFTWQLSLALGLFLISVMHFWKWQKPSEGSAERGQLSFKSFLIGIIISSSIHAKLLDFLGKAGTIRMQDNSYALYRDLLAYWTLQLRVNFVTGLKSCNPLYDNPKLSELWPLLKTLVVKPYCMYGVVMLAMFFRKWRKSNVPQVPNNDHVERAKNYVLEDFLEENRISMRDISNKETEDNLNECFKLLESCDFNYDRYKAAKARLAQSKPDHHGDFMNDIKRLKEQIHRNSDKQRKERNNKEEVAQAPTQKPQTEEIREKAEPPKEETKPSNSESADINGKSKPLPKRKSNRGDPSESLGGKLLSVQHMYSILQMVVFTILGLSVKKLFFMCFTQGCVIAPTICSKAWYKRHRNIFWSVTVVVFVLSMFDPGMVNIREEYFPKRAKQKNDDLDTMLEWINMNTERDAVFAGPVEIIGTVHLTTKRPIVNHAHLEYRQISDRTEHVYSVYSRQQSSDIFNQCSQLKVQYLIITYDECTNEISNDCDILSIWDDIQPAYRKFPQFCADLLKKNLPSFLKVFANEQFFIVKMFSQTVQINLKHNRMPEIAI